MSDSEPDAGFGTYRDKPIADQLRGLGNFAYWCSTNVAALGDPTRWFVELTTEIRRIAALPTGWQPIETAPMDGTRILVREDDFIAVAGWMTAIEDGTGAWIIWRQLGADAVAIRMLTPTHWQPLPEPPETTP